MQAIRFKVLGKARSRGSKSPWNPRRKDGSLVLRPDGRPVIATMDSDKESRAWMAEVRSVAAQHFRGDLLRGPVILTCRFWFPRPASHFGTGRNTGILKASAPRHHAQIPDLSKITRAIEDAISKVIWRDDAQIVRYGEGHGKYWTTGAACVEVEITSLEIHDGSHTSKEL
jgi:crossover junction endodeoxyribonuclease RusA